MPFRKPPAFLSILNQTIWVSVLASLDWISAGHLHCNFWRVEKRPSILSHLDVPFHTSLNYAMYPVLILVPPTILQIHLCIFSFYSNQLHLNTICSFKEPWRHVFIHHFCQVNIFQLQSTIQRYFRNFPYTPFSFTEPTFHSIQLLPSRSHILYSSSLIESQSMIAPLSRFPARIPATPKSHP